ncbi:hypothetical protein PoB_007707700 [Plakobranchus ocellatus]|uniref:Uncharacterized protein n=1 Tax=Plakobranchus ocellatus TaxID=259542 RepID=A0AAV4E2U0_9GAST|nr:hypothetical protein PoB_007707700 [Plakobranchus ocellatus]
MTLASKYSSIVEPRVRSQSVPPRQKPEMFTLHFISRGVGGTVVSESTLRSAGTSVAGSSPATGSLA